MQLKMSRFMLNGKQGMGCQTQYMILRNCRSGLSLKTGSELKDASSVQFAMEKLLSSMDADGEMGRRVRNLLKMTLRSLLLCRWGRFIVMSCRQLAKKITGSALMHICAFCKGSETGIEMFNS